MERKEGKKKKNRRKNESKNLFVTKKLLPTSSYFLLPIRHGKVFFFLSMLTFITEEGNELYWLLVENTLLNSSHLEKDMQGDIEP